MISYCIKALILFLPLVVTSVVFAAPTTFMYQGQIIKSNGQSLTGNVTFTIQVLSPGIEKCVLYEETHTVNMTGSEGAFSLSVGGGARSGTHFENTSNLMAVFKNNSNFTGLHVCLDGSSTSYVPTSLNDRRKIKLSYNDGSGLVAVGNEHNVQGVPYAWDTKTIDGLGTESLLQVNVVDNLTQNNLESIFAGTSFSRLSDVIDGTSSQYVRMSSNGAAVPSLSADPLSPTPGSFWFNTTTNKMMYFDNAARVVGAGGGGGGGPLAEVDIPTLSTAGKVVGTAIVSGTIGGTTAINTSGAITTTGTITAGLVSSGAASTKILDIYDSDSTQHVRIQTPATADLTSNYTLTLPVNDGGTGEFLTTDGAGVLSWTAGGDITAVSTTAPLAGGNTSGPISLTINYDNTSVGINGSSQLEVKTSGITAAKLATDAVETLKIKDGAVTDVKITGMGVGKITSGAGQYLTYMPNNVECTDGYVLKWTAADRWECAPDSGGAGDITSVSAGTGLTGGGTTGDVTLSIDYGSGANQVIQNMDIPHCAANQKLEMSLGTTYAWSCVSEAVTIATNIADTDGNTKIQVEETTNEDKIRFDTAGTERMIIDSNGRVGIGNNSPDTMLEVGGTIKIADGGESCTTGAHGGMIRYSGNNLQYCDGTDWQTIGVSTAAVNSLAVTAPLSGTATTGSITLSVNYDNTTVGLNGSSQLEVKALGVTAAKLAADAVETAKIKDGAVTDDKITSMAVDKISSATGKYFTYMPNNLECADGGVLKWDATDDQWKCGLDIDTNTSAVTSVFSRSGVVTAQSGDYTATQITNTPAGNIAAVTAQAAITELDTEKVSKAGDTMTGALTMTDSIVMNAQNEVRYGDSDSTNYVGFRGPATVGTNVIWTLPAADGGAGDVLSTSGTGVLSWIPASDGDITAVNTTAPLSGGNTAGAISLTLAYDNASVGINGSNQLEVKTSGISAAKLATDAVETIKIKDGAVTTDKMADGAVTDAKIAAVSVDKITSASGKYFTYMPNNSECADGGVLKWDATDDQWKCGLDIDTNTNAVTSVFSRSGVVTAQSGDYTAAQITNTPAGNIAAVTAQAAITELDTEKVSKAGDTMTGALTMTDSIMMNAQNEVRYGDSDSTNYVGFRGPASVGTNVVWTLPAADGGAGDVLSTSGTGVLSWTTPLTGDITAVNTTAPLAGGNTAGAITLTIGYDNSTIGMTANQLVVKTSGITATQLATDAVETAKIKNLAVTDGKINDVGVDKITSGSGKYFTYMPNNVECTDGYVLKWTAANRWECAQDSGGAGDITSVSAGTGLTGGGTTGDVTLSIDYGSGANQVIQNMDIPHCAANQKLEMSLGTTYAWSCVSEAVSIATNIADADGDTKIQVEESADEDKIRFDTAGSERMIIDSNGRVGIGTSNPASELELYGTNGGLTSSIGVLGIYTTDTQNVDRGASLMLGGQSGIGDKTFGGIHGRKENSISGDERGYFAITTRTAAGMAEALRITSSGNVGIGTSAPTTKLDVSSTDSTGLRSISTATPGGSSGGGVSLVASSKPTATNQRLGLLTFGAYNADVSAFRYGASIEANSSEAWANNTNQGAFLSFATTDSGAGTSRAERMRISQNGNVGIGTTSPGRLLHVNGPMRLTASALPGTPATGDIAVDSGDGNKLKWYDGSGWQAAGGSGGGGGMAGSADITGATYTITSGQGGYYFTYNGSSAGTINLPALSGLSDGFQVTIMRQVAQAVTITPDGSDSFPSGLTTLEMRGQNMQSVTLTKMGSKWNITNKTDDCVVGQSCWGTNSLYFGTFNGHQYFTTPGGCTNSGTPTCAGGTDSVTKAWANNSGTTAYNVNAIATDDFRDGVAQSATLASSYTDTDAAKFCEGMTYAGYSDWYLPSRQELNLLYQKSGEIGGFQYSSNYWSSTETTTTSAWNFNFANGYATTNHKTTAYYVRCVRRF